MYLSLLVPLDRSSFAEQALPWALSIARRAKARLDLVAVHALYGLDDPNAGWLPYDSSRDDENRQREQLYLDATAKLAGSMSQVSATTSVLSGSAVLPATIADSLLERALADKTDLIVMTTHGRGAMGRLGFGSVADEIIRRSHLPVLLVRPVEKTQEINEETVFENILIPLDGSTLAEQVLTPAFELAQTMGAQCTLIRVVESHANDRNGGASERTAAEEYLENVCKRGQEYGLLVKTQVINGKNVAEAILREAKEQGSSIIAMATHGRSGIKRLLLGSVADKLIQNTFLPVLAYSPIMPEAGN